MTDKDREEAMEELAVGIVALCIHEGPITEQMGEIKELIRDYDSRIRAKALREAAERAVDWFKGIGLGVSGLKSAHDELRSAILSADPSPDEGGARECVWTEDTDGLWETSCGRSWTFIEGGPEENGVRYCHGCGKPVRIADEPNKEE